ncbi:hypothetical protein [uncultured Roseobacter sp.]|uniref:hypothetical protein n=1 Tax=uncultured Roseobacter sp. TaxID=114847 RepID=UPI00260D1325|nr:hypothetical protein [uncultured Roseobacter sp.]
MIGVGIALGQGASQAGGMISAGPPRPTPAITVATGGLVPAVSRLYEGQSTADMVGYATMISAANFSSNIGPIASVDVTFLGSATAADAPLAEGETAGFSLRVTDSDGNSQTFSSGLTTVEYLYRDVTTATNELGLDINDLVDDAVNITFTLSGFTGDNIHYNDDYTFTAGYLRATNPITGTQKINFDGLAADLEEADVLRANEGLWVSDTGALTLTHQFMRDGVAIAGATGPTHAITAADIGTALTLQVTADDGVNPAVTTTSGATQIPASGLSHDFLGSAYNGSGDASNTFDFSGSGIQPGDTLYIGCLAQHTNNARQINGVRLNGGPLVAPRDETANDAATSTNVCACWCELTAPASPTMTIALESNVAPARSMLAVYRVPGATTVTDHAAVNDTDSDTVSSTISTATGDVILAIATDKDGAPASWTGVSGNTNRGGDRFEAGSQAVTATDANYTVAYVATTSSDSVLAALNLSGA